MKNNSLNTSMEEFPEVIGSLEEFPEVIGELNDFDEPFAADDVLKMLDEN